MSRETFIDAGPWRGQIEQPALCGQGAFERAFNIQLVDGEIRKRQGRLQLTRTVGVTPAVFAYIDTGNNKDLHVGTNDVSQGLRTGGTGVTPSTQTPTFLIGMPFPFDTVNFYIGTTSNGSGHVLSATYYNGAGQAARVIAQDRTQAFKYSGGVSFGSIPSDWKKEAPVVNGRRLALMYWLRLSPEQLSNVTIYDVQVELAGWAAVYGSPSWTIDQDGVDLRTAVNGIIRVDLPSGEKQVLVGMDDQANGYARLFEFKWNATSLLRLCTAIPYQSCGSFRTIRLPFTARSGFGALWRGVPYGGKMILTNGFCPPLVYDGDSCEPLNGLWGADSVFGARTYTPAPVARFFAAYNSALYAAGIDGAPRTVQRSENQNALGVFTGSEGEQVGGGNYWPNGQDFDVSTGDATRPETSEITGLGVIGGRVAILTRERIYLYDDSPELIPLGGNAGCIAPGSFATIGDVGFFLGDRTVWQVSSNGALEQIGQPIELTLKYQLSTSAIERAVAVVSPTFHEYRLYVPLNGDNRNRACLVYDYINKAWTIRGGQPPMSTNALGGQAIDANGNGDWFANLNTFQVAAAGRVNEIGEIEAIMTGDYVGGLWLEDEGEADSVIASDSAQALTHQPIFAFVATSRLLKETTYLKRFRELRLHARKEGNVNLYAMIVFDGEDAVGALYSSLIEARFSGAGGVNTLVTEGLAQTLSGDAIVPAAEGEAWFATGSLNPPAAHASTVNAGAVGSMTTEPIQWGTREFRQFKYSLAKTTQIHAHRAARTAQILIVSKDAFAPFSLRGYEMDFDIFPEAKR